jgi:hypothetical protein
MVKEQSGHRNNLTLLLWNVSVVSLKLNKLCIHELLVVCYFEQLQFLLLSGGAPEAPAPIRLCFLLSSLVLSSRGARPVDRIGTWWPPPRCRVRSACCRKGPRAAEATIFAFVDLGDDTRMPPLPVRLN